MIVGTDRFVLLARPPRSAANKATRAGMDEDMTVDDAASVCSNVSDATSIYDDAEGMAFSEDVFHMREVHF
jgi:hypothetical protein